jgi:4-amino-4-deoxy-L-arabinose transferase-like glycosyltransferase
MSPETSAPASARSWFLDLLLVALAVAALLGPHLGRRALWEPDEGRYAEISREMVATGDYLTPRLDGVKYFEKPPLFYWSVAGALEAFGPREAAVRLPGALFALLGCAAAYAAGRRLFGRAAGLWGAAVLATSLLWFGIAHTVNLDMGVSALIAAALLAFLAAAQEAPGWRRRGLVWAFYAAAALATLTKGLIGLLIPAAVIGLYILLFRQWRLLRLVFSPSGIAVFLLVAAPWHLLVARANPEWARFYFVHEHFERYLTRTHDRYEPPWYFLPVLLGGFLPWTLFLPRALAGTRVVAPEERRKIGFLLLWAGFVLAFFSLSSSKLIPYVLPAVPPLALLVGRALARAWEDPPHARLRPVLAGVMGLGAMLALPFLLPASVLGTKGAAFAGLLGGWRLAVGLALLALALAPFLLERAGRKRAALVAVAAGSALFLSAIAAALPRLDALRSVASIAAAIEARERPGDSSGPGGPNGPGDEVISYGQYAQGLPFYLGRRVTVAAFRGELEFGIEAEDTAAWMIGAPEFWRRWRGERRIFLVTDQRRWKRLRGGLAGAEPVARSGQYLLFVNR